MKKLILTALYSILLALTACSHDIYRDGKNGIDGATGPKGDAGGGCTVASGGAGALITCPDGTTAFVPNGTDGQDATPVTMVQFCPQVTGSYGSGSFPEQGFVIGGKVYGVYSSNGKASLAELYPGVYTTTAPGQNCTFVVYTDGTVSAP